MTKLEILKSKAVAQYSMSELLMLHRKWFNTEPKTFGKMSVYVEILHKLLESEHSK